LIKKRRRKRIERGEITKRIENYGEKGLWGGRTKGEGEVSVADPAWGGGTTPHAPLSPI